MSTAAHRAYDVVLYGATGFVGALTARYLAEYAPAGTKIALAGRSHDKLAAVRDGLPERAAGWPLLAADSSERSSLASMAASTRALATTVGPYARYGLPVVRACAAAGTHYADLTGELLFVREVIDTVGDLAQNTGARLVHSCGYDSVPSDLGVLLAHEQAVADGAGDLTEVSLIATARGGISGGTIDSLRGHIDTIHTNKAARKLTFDPYALSPDRAAEPDGEQPGDFALVGRGGPSNTWTGPFAMAGYNTKIVRRSNAVQDYAYGRQLRYGEAMGVGTGALGPVAAVATAAALAGVVAGMSVKPTRLLLDRVLPKPGAGPSQRARDRGWFRMDIDARTSSKTRYAVVVAGSGDPGYAATAVMLGESALCLALDGARLPDRAGSLTPAAAMGTVLIERLRAAGHTYSVGAV